jgi:hypothetical protein
MRISADQVSSGEKFVHRFGGWPSFHDANIHLFNRLANGITETITITVHLFRMTSKLDANNYFILELHTLATLRFEGCIDVALSGDEGGVIFDLEIKNRGALDTPTFQVKLSSSTGGIEGNFICDRIEVISVDPCDSRGELIPPNQSTDPTLSSGTAGAGHQPRHP